MRTLFLSERNLKEIVRDPLSVLLGLALPLGLLALFTSIGRSVPAEIFKVDDFAPAMIAFGFTFLTMFTAALMAKDRESSLLMRLFASPLTAGDYIAGYASPMIPVAVVQTAAGFAVAAVLGLTLGWGILWSFLALMPTAVMSIAVGVAMGSALTQNQVIGFGNLYIIGGSLLGGAWLDVSLLGGAFETIARLLPFSHGIDAARQALASDFSSLAQHLAWIVGYTVLALAIALVTFKRKMRG